MGQKYDPLKGYKKVTHMLVMGVGNRGENCSIFLFIKMEAWLFQAYKQNGWLEIEIITFGKLINYSVGKKFQSKCNQS